jgi:hypothetical protein
VEESEIAYLAGLLEGEGWFALSDSGHARIQLNMTDRDVVQEFARLVDSDSVLAYERPGRKVIYRVNLVGEKAVALMNAIYPFMGERRKARIDEVLGLACN